MFDNLFIEDDYDEMDLGMEEMSYFNPHEMNSDYAMESYSLVSPYYDDDEEYYYATESMLDAIDTDLVAIAMEADAAEKKSFKEKMSGIGSSIKEKSGNAWGKIRDGVAKVINRLSRICSNQYNKLNGKGKAGTRRAQFWYNMSRKLKNLAAKIAKNPSPEIIKGVQNETEAAKDKIEKALETDKITDVGYNMSNTNGANTRKEEVNKMREMYANTKGEYKDSNIKVYKKSVSSSKIKDTEEKIRKLKYKENHGGLSGAEQVRLNQLEDDLEKYQGWAEESFTYAGETYIVEDLELGYDIAVEGLFSKPKSAEKLLSGMQKKVGRLKTAGQCDDMLRQLDMESKKFNSAMGALKNAQGNFQKSNDKKAFKQAAGPVLKDLNKTCKILRIKSIAADPKNITQEEIKKLHDFITGAKQLVKARKQALASGANESYIGNLYDEDEDYDDIDFFLMMGQ